MNRPTSAEARRLNRIRSRMMRALRFERAHQLRQAVAEIASDIEAMVAGGPVADELCPSTLRSLAAELRKTDPAPPPDFFEVDVELDEAAPAVPVARPSGGP